MSVRNQYMMSQKTVLLVGANRGIGLNLARALAAKNWHVVASVRPETKESGDPSMRDIEVVTEDILEIDLKIEETIINASSKFGEGPLDMLINVAGVGPEPDHWHEHTSNILQEKILVNSIGPILTCKHFYRNLKKANGKIVNISSNAGSITMCKGEDLAYRMSKAALNMMTVSLAMELKADNITSVILSPGYVPTRLTNFRSQDSMDECVAGMVKVMDDLDISKTGQFFDWRGNILPW